MRSRRWATALIAVLVVVGIGVAAALMRDDVDRPLRIVRLATSTQPLSTTASHSTPAWRCSSPGDAQRLYPDRVGGPR